MRARQNPLIILIPALLILLVAAAVLISRWRQDSSSRVPERVPLRVAERHWRIPRVTREGYFRDPARVNEDINLRPTPGSGPDSVSELRIAKVAVGSPMYAAGFRIGDRILKVNEEPITTMGRAINLAQEIRARDLLTVQVERDGKVFDYRFDVE